MKISVVRFMLAIMTLACFAPVAMAQQTISGRIFDDSVVDGEVNVVLTGSPLQGEERPGWISSTDLIL